ncbi:hypothetical protein DDZ18_12070 [Marinicauda salina]|uniref:Uncharacterized protein n=2 Tax=Marinicauda salina TaxID=2135793 RepID=A0A2U2BRL4_9PROT|nr:hypothetical protein DDZ18_12070 [Marinicauda salina]
MDAVEPVLEFLRRGFDEVNAVQGLLIAAAAALLLPNWRRLPVFVLGATAAHIAIDVFAPAIAGEAAFRLPPLLEAGFWRTTASLLAGYLVVIPVLALAKRLVLRR